MQMHVKSGLVSLDGAAPNLVEFATLKIAWMTPGSRPAIKYSTLSTHLSLPLKTPFAKTMPQRKSGTF